MVDILTPEERSHRMSLVGSKDTKPEMMVRRLTHRMGFRYRLHQTNLPGKPDLVFRKRKGVIYVNGCFWHGHNNCKNARIPKSRTEYWKQKIEGNKKRDAVNKRRLKKMGWDYLVIWECEARDVLMLNRRIKAFLP